MVRTGAFAYAKYGYETTFGTAVTANKKFGLQDRVSSWSLTNNRINLAALNQIEPEKFAYGQQQGSLSIGYVLSNPWVFGAVYGAPSVGTVANGVATHTFPHAASGCQGSHTGGGHPSGQPKNVRSATVEVAFDASDSGGGDIVRTLKGCVTNSLAISTTVGQTVDVTQDMSYGKEDAPATTFTAGNAPSIPASEFPYTFAHARLKVADSILAQVQDLDITFSQNSDMLWGLNSHQAVSTYRRVFDITGRFRASWLDKNRLEDVLNQVSAGTSTNFVETVGGTIELEIVFTNGQSGANLKTITILGSGLAPTSINITGIEPVEPVFEEIEWQVKSCTINCDNSISAAEE